MLKKLSAQKLNEIIEAAITEFAHNGREKASMKEIASASGVSVGVLYNYYENKDALYNAALEKCFENLKNVISINTHEAGSLTELFSRLVDTVYSYADEHSAYLPKRKLPSLQESSKHFRQQNTHSSLKGCRKKGK